MKNWFVFYVVVVVIGVIYMDWKVGFVVLCMLLYGSSMGGLFYWGGLLGGSGYGGGFSGGYK